MKVTPVKNYKIPLYAAGMTAIMFAAAATGCTDPRRIRRDVPDKTDPTIETVEIAGDIQVADPTDDPVELEGEETFFDPTESVELAGVVAPDDPDPTAAPATCDKASSK